MRIRLIQVRTCCFQRLEQMLESALARCWRDRASRGPSGRHLHRGPLVVLGRRPPPYGDAVGTWAPIEVLLAHRTLPIAALEAAMTRAIASGVLKC
jgi:hypothetical protein